MADEAAAAASTPTESAPEEGIPDEGIPDEGFPEEGILEEGVTEEGVSEEIIPEESIPAESVPTEEEVPVVEEIPPPPPVEVQKKPRRHWVRPTFLNYNYIYDYRHNYYDDVIDFLDRRLRGLTRDTPRPQTWAERALRTYTLKPKVSEFIYYTAFRKEKEHCYKVAHTYRSDHSLDFFRRKFKSVLY